MNSSDSPNDKTDNPEAFASCATSSMGDVYHQPGMTLRDYFAAHSPMVFADAVNYHETPVSYEKTLETLAKMRFAYADAMLKVRA